MLRCAGRQTARLISNRFTATAPVLIGTSSVAVGSGSADLLQVLQHRDQSRPLSSWFAPTPALSSAKAVTEDEGEDNMAEDLIMRGFGTEAVFAAARDFYKLNSLLAREDSGSGDFGIATGLELEELEYQKKGKKRFDLDPPRGPFGTKNHPAVVESVFDERIVGCSGGVGEDEHDVTWFKLKKGEEFECPVCTQVFELKVVGEGGLPGAHH